MFLHPSSVPCSFHACLWPLWRPDGGMNEWFLWGPITMQCMQGFSAEDFYLESQPRNPNKRRCWVHFQPLWRPLKFCPPSCVSVIVARFLARPFLDEVVFCITNNTKFCRMRLNCLFGEIPLHHSLMSSPQLHRSFQGPQPGPKRLVLAPWYNPTPFMTFLDGLKFKWRASEQKAVFAKLDSLSTPPRPTGLARHLVRPTDLVSLKLSLRQLCYWQ